MKLLVKNMSFWIATLVLVGALLVSGLFLIPPLISQVSSNRAEINELSTKIAEGEQFLTTLRGIEQKSDQLEQLFEKAALSLPKEPQPEILILQLDGLLQSLDLASTKIEVPLTGAAEPAEGAEQTTRFTLEGTMSFDQVKGLIAKLRTLSRWNKLTAVDITIEEATTRATLTGEAYSKPSAPQTFSGAPSFLDNASAAFTSLNPFTTLPDVKTEGTFGRQNPFN